MAEIAIWALMIAVLASVALLIGAIVVHLISKLRG
jgi:hypothetical protein